MIISSMTGIFQTSDIYSAQFSGKHSEGSALVSRHVIGVDVALRMLPQLFK